MKDNYCFDIPKGGSSSLNILDYCFNETTQSFLLNAGLKKGMKVLEIGCGSGKMSHWIASVIGDDGQLVAIDNNANQIRAAQQYVKGKGFENATFIHHDANHLSDLNQKFDFIYCRFVLHHLSKPRQVIKKMYAILNQGGIAAIEEGIVNHGFVYPYSIGFGNERFTILDKHENHEGIQRDGNFGIKLYHTMHKQEFSQLSCNIVSPVLVTQDEKSLIKPGLIDSKQSVLDQGVSLQEWQQQIDHIDQTINDPSAIIAFYQSVQVSGVK